MSIHRSLKTKAALKRSRNVLTRPERIEKLKSDEKWEDGRSVFGLPTTKIVRIKPVKAQAAKPAEEAAAAETPAEGAPPAEAAAATKDAKPAKQEKKDKKE